MKGRKREGAGARARSVSRIDAEAGQKARHMFPENR
jgi:hypothetical protein